MKPKPRIVLLFGAVIVLAVLPLTRLALYADEPSPPSDGQAILALAGDLGICEESLVMISAEPTDAATILARIQDATTLRTSLAAQQAIRHDSMTVIATLADIVADTPESSLVQQYTLAIEQKALAESEIATIREDLLELALDQMPGGWSAAFAVWRSGADRSVPAAFRIASRTPAQWLAIEQALRAEERSQILGEELAEEHEALLLAIRTDDAVEDAELLLETNLAAMSSQFATVMAAIDE